MSSIGFASIVFASTFLGALLGIRSHQALPAHHLSSESKDLVRLCMGLIGTMTALILGLIVASAKSAFDAQDAALHAVAADIVLLDRTLATFGPDAKPVRDELREVTRARIEAAWSSGTSPAATPPGGSASSTAGERILQGILALTPKDDTQRWYQSQALSIASDALKTRSLSLTGSSSGVSTVFLIVITFWLSVLFWSFGLFAPRNATVIAVVTLACLSVSACVFLILEMQTPFSGILRISSAPLRLALEQLGR